MTRSEKASTLTLAVADHLLGFPGPFQSDDDLSAAVKQVGEATRQILASAMNVGDKVQITKGPHTGRFAEITRIKGPKTVELSVLDSEGRRCFRLWNVKKANLVKVED